MIPYSRYPGLSPLFLDFLKGLPRFYPDPPTLDACERRAREILAAPPTPRIPASAYRCRGAEAARLAEELAAGRAVAVQTGHQVGLFTGPLFTLMSCGVPVIGTAAGGLPEVVEDGRHGFLRPVGDVSAMASAGLDLLTDEKLWSRFSREARQRAEEEFPAEKMVKRYREIYERTLAADSLKSKSEI